jgi:hypothetical protein
MRTSAEHTKTPPLIRAIRGCLLTVFPLLAGTSLALADLPSIRFDRLAPLGAAAGTTIEVEVTGADVEGVDELLFDHPGFSAKPVAADSKTASGDTGTGGGRKRGRRRASSRFQVTVAASVPPGTYDVRLVGRWGVSNPRLFAVSHGLTDVMEKEPNNDAAQAQKIAVNSAVNGTFDGNGEDVFRFPAVKGQRIVIDCQAGRLDSPLDATMALSTADGKPLAASGDYNGRDPLIDFVAPADGEYLVTVYDLSYRGGSPYRLVVSDRPHVETVWPRAVRAGDSTELAILGRNLGGGAARSALSIGDLPLEERRLRIAPPPDDVPKLGAYRFLEHPTDHSVLPTAATCTLTGFQVRPLVETTAPSLTVHSLLVCDSAVTLEAEPNDEAAKPQSVALPLVLSGRFDGPRDADWFEFNVEEPGNYALDVYCERINGRADPYLVVTDDQGNRVTELDDYGHRINAFDGHLRDPSGVIGLAAKRKYRLLVQDRYGRGGARYQYVLTIRKPRPDFYAAVIHSQNPGPGGTTIWRGGAVYLDVILHHREGFGGDVTITAENLPPGVHAAPTVIANNTRGQFILWAEGDAPEFTGSIRLLASGRRQGADKPTDAKTGPPKEEVFTREVRPYTRVWNDASQNSSRPTRELVVAVRDSAPFGLRFEPERVEVEAGKAAQLKLKLARHWADFRGDVNVLPLEFPGQFRLAATKIAAGQDELTVTIDVQGGTRPGEYTLAALGQAQVPFNKDPEAKDRPPTLVSLPSRPLTIAVKPRAPAKP